MRLFTTVLSAHLIIPPLSYRNLHFHCTGRPGFFQVQQLARSRNTFDQFLFSVSLNQSAVLFIAQKAAAGFITRREGGRLDWDRSWLPLLPLAWNALLYGYFSTRLVLRLQSAAAWVESEGERLNSNTFHGVGRTRPENGGRGPKWKISQLLNNYINVNFVPPFLQLFFGKYQW